MSQSLHPMLNIAIKAARAAGAMKKAAASLNRQLKIATRPATSRKPRVN